MAARRDAEQACHRAGRILRPRTVDRQRLLPVRQVPQVGAWVFFCELPPPPASTRSPVPAPRPCGATPRHRRRPWHSGFVAAQACWSGLAFLFLGRSAAMPPSRYALTQLWTALTPAPNRSAACFRACRPAPVRLSWSFASTRMMGFAYGRHAGDPPPASIPGTAWSDSPDASPPGPWSSA